MSLSLLLGVLGAAYFTIPSTSQVGWLSRYVLSLLGQVNFAPVASTTSTHKDWKHAHESHTTVHSIFNYSHSWLLNI